MWVYSLFSGIPGIGLYAGLIGLRQIQPVAAPYLAQNDLREKGRGFWKSLNNTFGKVFLAIGALLFGKRLGLDILRLLVDFQTFVSHPRDAHWDLWFKMIVLGINVASITAAYIWAFKPFRRHPPSIPAEDPSDAWRRSIREVLSEGAGKPYVDINPDHISAKDPPRLGDAIPGTLKLDALDLINLLPPISARWFVSINSNTDEQISITRQERTGKASFLFCGLR